MIQFSTVFLLTIMLGVMVLDPFAAAIVAFFGSVLLSIGAIVIISINNGILPFNFIWNINEPTSVVLNRKQKKFLLNYPGAMLISSVFLLCIGILKQ